eukprot:gene3163-7843_t
MPIVAAQVSKESPVLLELPKVGEALRRPPMPPAEAATRQQSTRQQSTAARAACPAGGGSGFVCRGLFYLLFSAPAYADGRLRAAASAADWAHFVHYAVFVVASLGNYPKELPPPRAIGDSKVLPRVGRAAFRSIVAAAGSDKALL